MTIFGFLSLALQDGDAAPGGLFGGSMVTFLMMIGMLFLVFYFLVFRPEKKRKQKMQHMISELKAGDKVITIGGIHGTVVGVTDKTVIIRIYEQVKLEINRQAVGTIVTPEGEIVESDKK